jgi:hypothetical protein
MISITPGHLGIFEATLLFIYQYLGLSATEAMILALFVHLVFLLGAVPPGAIVAACWGFRLRGAEPPATTAVAAAPHTGTATVRGEREARTSR